jgi:hypothetical protein
MATINICWGQTHQVVGEIVSLSSRTSKLSVKSKLGDSVSLMLDKLGNDRCLTFSRETLLLDDSLTLKLQFFEGYDPNFGRGNFCWRG